jgi:hypothetical protein
MYKMRPRFRELFAVGYEGTLQLLRQRVRMKRGTEGCKLGKDNVQGTVLGEP